VSAKPTTGEAVPLQLTRRQTTNATVSGNATTLRPMAGLQENRSAAGSTKGSSGGEISHGDTMQGNYIDDFGDNDFAINRSRESSDRVRKALLRGQQVPSSTHHT